MAKASSLSGFPEWLPRERMVEERVLATARRIFELHGFGPIETRSVEPLEEMLRKGAIDKEVYVISRLHETSPDAARNLALHFDLTIPFARYVLENAGHLDFPFRRYQIQKAWRGERPQEGRFREFTQADIDVVGKNELSYHYEIEMAAVMAGLLRELPIPRAVIRVNNRKLIQGFYESLGIDEPMRVLRIVDKLEKAGQRKVSEMLQSDAGLTSSVAETCLKFAAIRGDDDLAGSVRALGIWSPEIQAGLEELEELVAAVNRRQPNSVIADLSIARGLDYYTGTVYETTLVGYEKLGSIASGGRYDSLVSDSRVKYPGVGISLGVTRLVSILLGRDLVSVSRSVPSVVLVTVEDETRREEAETVAVDLRARDISCEVAPPSASLSSQLKLALRLGIPFVSVSRGDSRFVRDLRSGEEVAAELWSPDPLDLKPLVTATHFEGQHVDPHA